MGYREVTDGELFERRMERNRIATMQRHRDSAREVVETRKAMARPDDACMVCGSRDDVRPIYGKRLPGCCPEHWPDARAGVLKLILGVILQIAIEGESR